jgi:hypothetical protein
MVAVEPEGVGGRLVLPERKNLEPISANAEMGFFVGAARGREGEAV